MKVLLSHTTLVAALALCACSQQDNWTGVLVDADCKTAAPMAECPVNPGTRAFGLDVDGRFLPFDEVANSQIRMSEQRGNPVITVTGKLEGGELKVREIGSS